MSTTYALEQYRALIADGYRFETSIGRGGFLSKRLVSFAVPAADARAVRELSNAADREDSEKARSPQAPSPLNMP